jgi:ABC-type glutathione transport system ATPase component
MSLLDVSGLGIDYPDGSDPVVRDLSFAIDAGESLGVVGESGSGKTQTALAVMGLLPADARVTGRILFDGESLLGADERTFNRIRARRIAMVFQDPALALNPYLRIGDQLRAILTAHAVVPRGQRRQRGLELLQRVGLPDVERQSGSFPHQLSGGMRQRAMIAMALAAEPVLLIADEPTTALDVTVQAQILELVRGLRADTGIALMLITHDLGVIAGNCDRMLVMHEGRMLETGETRDVFAGRRSCIPVGCWLRRWRSMRRRRCSRSPAIRPRRCSRWTGCQ